MKTKEQLIAEVEEEARNKIALIDANMSLINECAALEAKLIEAGIEAHGLACAHSSSVSCWIVNYDQKDSEIRAAIKKAGVDLVRADKTEDKNYPRQIVYVLAGTSIRLEGHYASEPALQVAA